MPADFRVVIPARYGSTRLPGKPLLLIAGRPMVAHVWDRAIESGAAEVIIATDDERIVQAAESFGGRAIMTSPEHASGTDRLAEVASTMGWANEQIVINLQGDEPLLPAVLVAGLAGVMQREPRAAIATLATPLRRFEEVRSSNVVKVVCDRSGFALYFSRAPIPWLRGTYESPPAAGELPGGASALRHIGLYGYRVSTLKRMSAEPPVALELAESLEQLRALDLGLPIHVTVVDDAPPHGVDTADDLRHVEEIFLRATQLRERTRDT